MSLKVNAVNEIGGFKVRINWFLWQGSGWYSCHTPHTISIGGRYLNKEGSWRFVYDPNLIPAFRSLADIELALTKGALLDWNGTSPLILNEKETSDA